MEALDPNQPIRLGLIHNPQAGRAHRWLDRVRLSRVLPESGRIVTTRHESEVPAALERLLMEEQVNVIAIHGGDGTIHTTLNALWQVLDALQKPNEAPLPLPSLIFLNGGTMNMTARAMGLRGGVSAALGKFKRATQLLHYGDLSTVPLSVLRIQEGNKIRRGLIFGSELVYNAIDLHRHFGDGYTGLTRLLVKAGVGATLKTASWKHLSHLLSPPSTPVQLDKITYAKYAAVVASTVDLQLVRGWVKAMKACRGGQGFATKLILETNKQNLVNLIPNLLLNQSHGQIVDRKEVQCLRLKGPYTLDGELFRSDSNAICTVSLEPRAIPVVTFGESAHVS